MISKLVKFLVTFCLSFLFFTSARLCQVKATIGQILSNLIPINTMVKLFWLKKVAYVKFKVPEGDYGKVVRKP